GDQVFEDVVLFGSEVRFAVAHRHQARFKINGQVLRYEGWECFSRGIPAKGRADARKQLFHAKWFDHVIVSARVQGRDLVSLRVSHRQHDDGRVRSSPNL